MADHEHDPDPTVGAAALHELVEGVHAWVQPDGTWWVNNAGAVVGGDEVMIVDTCATEARTRRFLDAVAEVTDAPVRWAANTHEHGDHTYGNCLLPDDAALIGHANMRANLLVDPLIDGCPPAWSPVPDWGNVTRRVPQVTTTQDVTVHVGGERVVELRHPGFTAHTTGDLVAWLPEERVLFTGDLLFHGLTPLVFAGSVDGALASLDWIESFEPDHVVPGHGPLVAADQLDAVLDDHGRYYRFVREVADAGQRDGLSPLDAVRRTDLREFARWDDSERLVLNVHRAYADAEDRPLDLTAAILDAVTWNEAPLTTHVCCV